MKRQTARPVLGVDQIDARWSHEHMIKVGGRASGTQQSVVEHPPIAGECVEQRAYPPLAVSACLPSARLPL
jgi:hypothetical protein